MQNQEAPALVKALIMSEMERVTRAQPFAWGMHLCPTLQADLIDLKKTLGGYPLRSEDWMVPKVRNGLGLALTKFFQARQGRQYMKEALARRELWRDLSVAALKYGGYVESDLTLRLNNAARAQSEVWVLGKSGPLVVSTAAVVASEGALALSPVFFIPADRAALMQRYYSALTGSSTAEPVQDKSAESPFLNLR
jgi:hypothetical protein